MDITTALRRATLEVASRPASPRPFDHLRSLLTRIALHPETWASRVRHEREERWYELLLRTDAVDAWIIGWWPGQWTPLHDHGGASGALTVLGGALTEERIDGSPARRRIHRLLTPGTTLDVAADVVHRVGNAGPRLATSIHAYSPPGVDIRVRDHDTRIRRIPSRQSTPAGALS